MKESLIFGICMLASLFLAGCVVYTVTNLVLHIKNEIGRKKLRRENDEIMHPSEIIPGDVIVEDFDWKNPFQYDNLVYETVSCVMRNDRGELYFKTYSSDFDGKPLTGQTGKWTLHELGRKYYKDDWVLVNHIEPEKQ